jgi:O-antigen ligase
VSWRAALAAAAACLGAAVLLRLLMQPTLALVLAAAVVLVFLARRSVAYPLALAGLPPVIFAVFGSNPLPRGTVTGIVAGAIIIAVVFAVVERADPPPPWVFLAVPVVVSVALLAVMLLRLGDSPATDVGSVKVQLFAVGNLLFLLGGLVVGWRIEDVPLLLGLVLAIAVAGAVILVVKFSTGQAETVLASRFAVTLEEGPIALGRAAGAGLLIALYVLMSARPAALRLLVAGTAPVLAVGLFASGSRGPALGLAVGLIVLLALGLTGRTALRGVLLFAGAVMAAIVVVAQVVPQSSISRTLSFVSGDAAVSSNGRTQLWSSALDMFDRAPLLGEGTGAFAALPSQESYPHNLFLELAAELGLIGLALGLAMAGGVAVSLTRAWRSARGEELPLAAAILALFSGAVVNAMFSGAIYDNRAVWLWGGVAVGISARVLAPARAGPLRVRARLEQPVRQHL